jgi:hypothetical protein
MEGNLDIAERDQVSVFKQIHALDNISIHSSTVRAPQVHDEPAGRA